MNSTGSTGTAVATASENSTVTKPPSERTGKCVSPDENGKGASSATIAPDAKFTPVQLKPNPKARTTCVDALREFMEVTRLVGEVHSTRFRIDAGFRAPDEFREVFEDFMDLVGSSVTFLSLYWTTSSQLSVEHLGQLVFERTPLLEALYIQPCNYDEDELQSQVLQSIPNLRRIKVTTSLTSWTTREMRLCRALRLLIIDVVQAADNLQYIALTIDRSDQNFVNTILTMLRQFPAASLRVSKLKTLKISVQTPEELRLLIQLSKYEGLRLETLSMSVFCFNTKLTLKTLATRKELITLIYEFLVKQRQTLRKFSLDFRPVIVSYNCNSDRNNYGAPFRIPRMQQLHTFKLRVPCSAEMRIELEFEGRRSKAGGISSFSMETLANIFPCLERLVGKDQNGSDWNGSISIGPPPAPATASAAQSGGGPQTKTTDDPRDPELDPFVFNECKQKMRPVKGTLNLLDNTDPTLSEVEEVRKTRRALLTIGDHIEECLKVYKDQDLVIKTWRTRLWSFVSQFTDYDAAKLYKSYRRSQKADMKRSNQGQGPQGNKKPKKRWPDN